MKEIQNYEKYRTQIIYLTENMRKFECEFEAISVKAIHYLKKAYKKHPDDDIKIALTNHYINGDILPYNYKKAIKILETINNPDEQTQQLITKTKSGIKSPVFKTKKQEEMIQKANEGKVLYMLYVAFALYTGFDGFPISHNLSIEYYRKAAKKSSHAMTLLGVLYYKGIFFPKNYKRAHNCFRRGADDGNIKAGIIESILYRYTWRNYLVDFDINTIFSQYLQSSKSYIMNDSLAFTAINYYLTSETKYKYVFNLCLHKSDPALLTDNEYENFGMHLSLSKSLLYQKNRPTYSEKIILNDYKYLETEKADEQLEIAKKFLYGNDNFPANISKALKYFQHAADNGNSEAQWRYAILLYNIEFQYVCKEMNISYKKDLLNKVEKYLKKSIKQNNLTAKFYYALLLLEQNNDKETYQQIINELCDSDYIEAFYLKGMTLETEDKSLDQSLPFYLKAAEQGHFDSLIRLIYTAKIKSEKELYNEYLTLSVGILNEWLLVKLINLFDKNKKYDQSNILISIGIKLNYQLFAYFYADHLLYGKGIESNIEIAEKISYLAFNEGYKKIYWERYLFLILEILIQKNEHNKAVKFLIYRQEEINIKYRNKFLLFYSKIDKKIAEYYFINAHFIDKNYQACHSILFGLRSTERKNPAKIIVLLSKLFKYENNPYAMAILGKIYKQGKYTTRQLKKAIQLFEISVQYGCPLGYYFLGKEFLYGRFLHKNVKKAKEYLLIALKNNREPRAGYYLFKMSKDNRTEDDIKYLKISVFFGYSKALYKYGHYLLTGKDEKIQKDKDQGIKLIQQSAYQNNKKAIKFCNIHHIPYNTQKVQLTDCESEDDKKNDELSINEDDEETSFSKFLACIDYRNNFESDSIQSQKDDGSMF